MCPAYIIGVGAWVFVLPYWASFGLFWAGGRIGAFDGRFRQLRICARDAEQVLAPKCRPDNAQRFAISPKYQSRVEAGFFRGHVTRSLNRTPVHHIYRNSYRAYKEYSIRKAKTLPKEAQKHKEAKLSRLRPERRLWQVCAPKTATKVPIRLIANSPTKWLESHCHHHKPSNTPQSGSYGHNPTSSDHKHVLQTLTRFRREAL